MLLESNNKTRVNRYGDESPNNLCIFPMLPSLFPGNKSSCSNTFSEEHKLKIENICSKKIHRVGWNKEDNSLVSWIFWGAKQTNKIRLIAQFQGKGRIIFSPGLIFPYDPARSIQVLGEMASSSSWGSLRFLKYKNVDSC